MTALRGDNRHLARLLLASLLLHAGAFSAAVLLQREGAPRLPEPAAVLVDLAGVPGARPDAPAQGTAPAAAPRHPASRGVAAPVSLAGPPPAPRPISRQVPATQAVPALVPPPLRTLQLPPPTAAAERPAPVSEPPLRAGHGALRNVPPALPAGGSVGLPPASRVGAGDAAVAGSGGSGAPPSGAGSGARVPDHPAAGSGGPAKARGGAAVSGSYQALLKSLVEAHKNYPVAARASGRAGSCQRRFTLSRDGSLQQVESLSSCGHPFLDEAATRAITGVGRFPPFPDEVRGAQQSFTVTITFNLRK